MIEKCLLIHDGYLKLILDKKKTWEVRTQQLFTIGERIALGNIEHKLIEGYATVSDIKKMTVDEMKKHNDKHFANDFIDKRWKEENGSMHLFFQNLSLIRKKKIIRLRMVIQKYD